MEEEGRLKCELKIGVDEGRGGGLGEGSKGKISETRLKEASAFSQIDKL